MPSESKAPEHLVALFAEAIAHFEGYYSEYSAARRNNNPGNLRGWDRSLPKDRQGFDIFPTRVAGFAALRAQIRKNIDQRRLSLYEFFAGKEGVYPGYAPEADGNRPYAYAEFVRKYLDERGVLDCIGPSSLPALSD